MTGDSLEVSGHSLGVAFCSVADDALLALTVISLLYMACVSSCYVTVYGFSLVKKLKNIK